MQFREQFFLGVRCFSGLLTFRCHRAQNQSGYGGYSDEKLQKGSIVQRIVFYEGSISRAVPQTDIAAITNVAIAAPNA